MSTPPEGLGPLPRGPRFWLVTLAALLALCATAAMGRWQLQRAAQKEAVAAAISRQQALPPVDGLLLASSDEDTQAGLLHRRVALRGRWLPQYTVYLDNRQMFGRPGFFVLTPLELSPGLVVLVQRGWIARDFEERGRLQPVATPDGPVRLEARLEPSPSRLYEFAGEETGNSLIRQNLGLAAFRRETGLPLASLLAVQTGPAGEGLQREWPAVASGVERHYGYAFQWFGLSALIVFLYAWFQFIRRPRAA